MKSKRNEKINIGVLGAARIAPRAMIKPASQREDCQIIAIACRDKTRGELFAKQHGIAFLESNYEDLISRDDIDLIYNALPPSRHADLSITALRAGKAVLCEKPFAMNAAEARSMVKASIESGRPLVEAFHYRFHPAFETALSIISAGEIGIISHMKAKFTAPIPYKKGDVRHTLEIGGGCLMDLGCYPVHWSRQVMKSEPRVLDSKCIISNPDIDITTQARLDFGNGRISEIECSMHPDSEPVSYLKIWGSRGYLEFKNPLAPHNGHQIRMETEQGARTFNVQGKSTYDHQLDHMLKVMEGSKLPITGGADAVMNMTVIDAIYKQAGLNVRK